MGRCLGAGQAGQVAEAVSARQIAGARCGSMRVTDAIGHSAGLAPECRRALAVRPWWRPLDLCRGGGPPHPPPSLVQRLLACCQALTVNALLDPHEGDEPSYYGNPSTPTASADFSSDRHHLTATPVGRPPRGPCTDEPLLRACCPLPLPGSIHTHTHTRLLGSPPLGLAGPQRLAWPWQQPLPPPPRSPSPPF